MPRFLDLIVFQPIGLEDQAINVFNTGPSPAFAFPPKDHVSLAEGLDIVDFRFFFASHWFLTSVPRLSPAEVVFTI